MVLYVLLPPLLWSAGLESSYVALRRNIRPIRLLAVGLPLATTFAVGFVAYKIGSGADGRGCVDARGDRGAAGRGVGDRGRTRLGLPRRMMTLLGGESLLNDATALTAYKVALAAAIGTAASWGTALAHFRAGRGRRRRGRYRARRRDRLHPVAPRRSSGGERNRVGGAVHHLLGRRGDPRLRA